MDEELSSARQRYHASHAVDDGLVWITASARAMGKPAREIIEEVLAEHPTDLPIIERIRVDHPAMHAIDAHKFYPVWSVASSLKEQGFQPYVSNGSHKPENGPLRQFPPWVFSYGTHDECDEAIDALCEGTIRREILRNTPNREPLVREDFTRTEVTREQVVQGLAFGGDRGAQIFVAFYSDRQPNLREISKSMPDKEHLRNRGIHFRERRLRHPFLLMNAHEGSRPRHIQYCFLMELLGFPFTAEF